MATIINNPGNQGGGDSVGMGLLISILVIVFLGILFYMYGLPALRAVEEREATVQKIEIQVPAENPVTVTQPSESPE